VTLRPFPALVRSGVLLALFSLLAPHSRADHLPAAGPAKPRIDYGRSVRPILSNNCFKCHGPDAKERKADLRLDARAEALRAVDSGRKVIFPGDPSASALVRRIFSSDDEERMPPPSSQKRLTDAEKEILKQWIAEGAPYQEHWSFVPPRRPPLPAVRDTAWPLNGIDRFILARLEAEGLRPSPEAAKAALLRRLTLDLTGLPPTPAEIDAFLVDEGPRAYEAAVDRLLASPHFGERLGLEWLDAARFADTHGYHIDSGRDMTRWREWVIGAFNRNLPFDQFTVQQLAGDLLPDAGPEERLASGFNRNHMINFEGGAIPEEYQTAYIVDRVNTTATVWLGLTVACTQCHDHKFDPLTQKEFYQFYAFFNNVPENGLDGQKGNAAPFIKVPTQEEKVALDRLSNEIRRLEELLEKSLPEADAAQGKWEAAAARDVSSWTLLDPADLKSRGGAILKRLKDISIVAEGDNPPTDSYTVTARTRLREITALKLEALPDEKLAAKGPGRSSNGNFLLTEIRLNASLGEDGPPMPVAFKTASADFSQKGYPVKNAIDGKAATGWAIHPEVGKPHAAVFELSEPLRSEGGILLTMSLDFDSGSPQHGFGRFRLSTTSSSDPHAKDLPEPVRKALFVESGDRSGADRDLLRKHFRSRVFPGGKSLQAQIEKLRKESAELESRVPTSMVMQEMAKPRDTYLLVRGQYDKQGEQVSPGVPACLPPLPAGAPPNRLGLARWLVDPSHPLTSRVIVNRFWQMLFGTGLVKTAEDFGSQGEAPSHPELLDWLAAEFLGAFPPHSPRGDGGAFSSLSPWDVKGLLRLMVTSATYRQSSRVTPDRLERDPENRLLARGPRRRLQAEFIRDQALAVSGLLDPRIGGASVSPYQPPGLWEELASREDGANWTAQVYRQSHGPDLYRRTMYTFWKRTSPPPTLSTFDAPDRETCTVRRACTNTPLQALILLNDPTYVESSRKLAERMMKEAGPSNGERIALAFRLATGRRPEALELEVLEATLAGQLAVYRKDREAALKLLAVGESPRDEKLDPGALAAFTVIASMILNLDETLTKG
jgi:hypothetical protein